jgi:hypothetical protein
MGKAPLEVASLAGRIELAGVPLSPISHLPSSVQLPLSPEVLEDRLQFFFRYSLHLLTTS